MTSKQVIATGRYLCNMYKGGWLRTVAQCEAGAEAEAASETEGVAGSSNKNKTQPLRGERELARCVEEALCGGIGCGKGWDKKGKGQQGKWRQIMLGERKGSPEELRALYLRVGMNFVRMLG